MYYVYTQPACSYCTRAKTMLQARGLPYQELDLVADRAAMTARVVAAGGAPPTTAPQIFLDNQYIGGFEQLAASLAGPA
jgi:glutaredoxin